MAKLKKKQVDYIQIVKTIGLIVIIYNLLLLAAKYTKVYNSGILMSKLNILYSGLIAFTYLYRILLFTLVPGLICYNLLQIATRNGKKQNIKK